MTLVDCLDSVLMLYAYISPDQENGIIKWSIIEKKQRSTYPTEQTVDLGLETPDQSPYQTPTAALGTIEPDHADYKNDLLLADVSKKARDVIPELEAAAELVEPGPRAQSREQQMLRDKGHTISSLSISLTLLSILVALR